MTMIDGIGDEVTLFFIGLIFGIVIITIAWWSTAISENRHTQAVWLLGRRRIRARRHLTNHTHTVTITDGTGSTAEDVATSTTTTNNTTTSTTPETSVIEGVKPPEPGTSQQARLDEVDEEEEEDDERNRIVETMDSDTSLLRQRRVAFYNRNPIDESDTSTNSVIMEHNYADRSNTNPENPQNHPELDKEIRIKLKYINDEQKLVQGKLQEQLGDFKKRHFQEELSANKLVRLIFNGQVLQPDNKTLQNYGLFDNCVVHCLIHQRRVASEDEINIPIRNENLNGNRHRNLPSNNNNNQGRDWDFGNTLFIIISLILVLAWYFRYVYSHLYTITATVGLMLMTGLFTIVLIGMQFPDQEPIPPHRDEM